MESPIDISTEFLYRNMKYIYFMKKHTAPLPGTVTMQKGS